MSTTIEKPVVAEAANEPVVQNTVWWIHLGGLFAQLPLLLIYFRDLWDQPHYQFFPIALALALFLIFTRVNWKNGNSYAPGFAAFALLFISIPFLIGAVILFEPLAVSIGAFFYTGSILVSLKDAETGGTLIPVWFILAVIVRPLNYDDDIIQGLQLFTSDFSSTILDYLRVDHIPVGNTIELLDRKLGVAEQCSGVQSLFTLLFCSIAFAVLFRRPILRSLALVLSAVFWALFMNTMRVVIITYALVTYDIDWTAGASHATLGYVMLGIAILMIVSTDFFITFMFGPVGDDSEGSNKVHQYMQTAWNRVVAGQRRRTVRQRTVANLTIPVIVLAIVAIPLGVIPVLRAGIGVVAQRVISPLDVIHVEKELCANDSGNWKFLEHKVEVRDLTSEWGTNSKMWMYTNTQDNFSAPATVSCDYPFTGWHELANCYRGAGWQEVEGKQSSLILGPDEVENLNLDKELKDEIEKWPAKEVVFTKPEGSRIYVIFSLVDEQGEPMFPPDQERHGIDFANKIIAAVQRRLTRPYGPDQATYQVQLNHIHFTELTPAQLASLRQNFLIQRDKIRDFVASQNAE